jgi:hypothetical protein
MEKVLITMVTGQKMLFPAQYAKKVIRKNELVDKAYQLQKILKVGLCSFELTKDFENELNKTMRQIRSLNRQIPPCGEVVR